MPIKTGLTRRGFRALLKTIGSDRSTTNGAWSEPTRPAVRDEMFAMSGVASTLSMSTKGKSRCIGQESAKVTCRRRPVSAVSLLSFHDQGERLKSPAMT